MKLRMCKSKSSTFVRHFFRSTTRFKLKSSFLFITIFYGYDSLKTVCVVPGCGGEMTSSRGSIISPNYPQSYPLNADCEWKIRTSAGSVISISIVEIDIEEHHTCRYDYLQVNISTSYSSVIFF